MKLIHLLSGAAAFDCMMVGSAAAEMTAGQVEYQQACASCHGVSGKSDGPVAPHMTVEVPDLTTIRANNDGAFPFQELLEMIDGRLAEHQPGPHGTAMPVWGDRFMFESGLEDPVAAEINTLGRMSSLVYHIYRIQE